MGAGRGQGSESRRRRRGGRPWCGRVDCRGGPTGLLCELGETVGWMSDNLPSTSRGRVNPTHRMELSQWNTRREKGLRKCGWIAFAKRGNVRCGLLWDRQVVLCKPCRNRVRTPEPGEWIHIAHREREDGQRVIYSMAAAAANWLSDSRKTGMEHTATISHVTSR